MSGLILLAVLVGFVFLLIWLSDLLTRCLPISQSWKALLRIVIVFGVFPLILADEIIGKYQFDSLCRKHQAFDVGLNDPKGRTARVEIIQEDHPMPGLAIPIYRMRIAYRDVVDGKILVAYERFSAKGGMLVRLLNFPENLHPILIAKATCSPEVLMEKAISNIFDFNTIE